MTTVYSLLETGHLVLSRWKWDLCPYFAFRNRQAKYKPSGMKTNSFGLPIQGRSVHESLGLKFPKFPILKKKCSVKFQRWGNTNISNLVFWNRAMVFHIRLLLQLFHFYSWSNWYESLKSAMGCLDPQWVFVEWMKSSFHSPVYWTLLQNPNLCGTPFAELSLRIHLLRILPQ